MATDDKKHYKEFLKLMATTAKGSSLANRLSSLAIDAEDPNLQRAAKGLAGLVRPNLGQKDPSVNLNEMAGRLFHSPVPGHKEQGISIQKVNSYCQSAVDSVKPSWQIIALSQGWTPPAPVG